MCIIIYLATSALMLGLAYIYNERCKFIDCVSFKKQEPIGFTLVVSFIFVENLLKYYTRANEQYLYYSLFIITIYIVNLVMFMYIHYNLPNAEEKGRIITMLIYTDALLFSPFITVAICQR